MNWYYRIKIANFLKTSNENSFEELLNLIYELEYKSSMLQYRQFNGHPKRKENILMNLSNEIYKVGSSLKNIFLKVYENWLSSHALLDPDMWAEARMKECNGEDIKEKLIVLTSDFHSSSEADSISDKMNPDKSFFESFLYKLFNEEDLPETFKNMKRAMLEDYVFISSEDAIKEEDIESLIENLETDEVMEYYEEIMSDSDSLENMINGINNNTYYDIDEDQFIKDLYKHMVFPVWYEKWANQGIEETRENIEKTYEMLKTANPSDPKDITSKLNLAINQAHQTGSMIEYFEEEFNLYDLDKIMSELTQGKSVEKWNNELREIGVVI